MPPWPTSSSTSYRPAIFSPTTGETLPGRRVPHAPEPQPEPQAAAPDRVQEHDEAGEEPEWDEGVAFCVRRAALGERDRPADREEAADSEHDAWPSEARYAQREREHEGHRGDHVAGHAGSIGAQPPSAESRASSQTPRASSSSAEEMTNGTRTRMQFE